jgi:hypothetical protein
MPTKSKSTAKKTEPKQKQKQSPKQTVNVIINNEKKKKATVKKKVLSSSQKVDNVKKSLIRGTPSNDMIYRSANINRPVNYNVVPELPMTGNQLMAEMRQIMNAHVGTAQRTPMQMTEDVKRGLMNKANGIVNDIKQNQTEIDASNKIKARIKQKISSDALEEIIEEAIDLHTSNRGNPQSTPARNMRPRRVNVRIAGAPTRAQEERVTMAMYRQVMGASADDPPLNVNGSLRKGTLMYREYMRKKKTN